MPLYLLVRWFHGFADEPILLYSELNDERFETRKIEIYRDGRAGLAGDGLALRGSRLGDQPVPDLAEIAAAGECAPQEITLAEFAAMWQIARRIV